MSILNVYVKKEGKTTWIEIYKDVFMINTVILVIDTVNINSTDPHFPYLHAKIAKNVEMYCVVMFNNI